MLSEFLDPIRLVDKFVELSISLISTRKNLLFVIVFVNLFSTRQPHTLQQYFRVVTWSCWELLLGAHSIFRTLSKFCKHTGFFPVDFFSISQNEPIRNVLLQASFEIRSNNLFQKLYVSSQKSYFIFMNQRFWRIVVSMWLWPQTIQRVSFNHENLKMLVSTWKIIE